MKKIRTWLLDILRGIGIGIACMIPGVSGGTFALLTGCYDKIIFSVANIFKQFFKSVLVLIPLLLGAAIGMFLGFIGIRTAFAYILFSIIAFFAGLILGSIPSLFKEVKKEESKNTNALALILAFLFVAGIGLIGFVISLRYPHYSIDALFTNPKWYTYLIMIPAGTIAAFALVAPGVSGSMIMLVLGFYEPILDMIHNLTHLTKVLQNGGLLLCYGVGVALGFVLMTKFMKYMLSKHRSLTYSIIIGFVMGSLVAIFLNKDIYLGTETYKGLIANPFELFLGIPLLAVGAVGSYFAIKFSSKKENQHAKD